MSINKKIPTLATKLDGPATYPPWARSLEKYLDIIEIPDSEFRVWEVVTGGYPKPTTITEAAPTAAGAERQKQIRMWKDADAVALLTIEKNCTEDIQARIGNCETAASAYQELKKAFEGKTTTEFGALLDSFVSIQFDDRKSSVTEHIAHYERIWNTFAGIISRVELDKDDGFGKGLKNFAGSDKAKTEFLLRSFPAFYANTIENIKSKEPTYDDAVRKLKEYVPARQKGSKRKEAGTQEDPVVLKAEVKDNGKRCDYCIAKGWKGLNHTEKECYTKKREKAKAKKAKAKEEEEGSEDEGVTIKMIRIGKTECGHDDLYEYDTAATHHTTNEFDRLTDTQHHLEIPVRGHDGSESICTVMGTLVFKHNGRIIRHEQCLYDPSYSNIISGLRMPDDFTLKGTKTSAELKTGRKVLYKMKRDDNGLWIKLDNHWSDWKAAGIKRTNSQGEDAVKLARELHERYGHISYNTLRTLPEYPKAVGKEKIRCKACEQGKATKPAAPKQPQETRSSRLMERIHADLIGPIKPSTPAKEYKYLLTIVEDHSRYIIVIPLREKRGVGAALITAILATKGHMSTDHNTRKPSSAHMSMTFLELPLLKKTSMP